MHLLTRLRNLWRRSRLEHEFDEELQFHLDMRIDRNLRGGMTRRDAETEAHRHMGSALRAREGMHEARVIPWLESLGRDITLKEVQQYAADELTDAKLAEIQAEFDKIPAK